MPQPVWIPIRILLYTNFGAEKLPSGTSCKLKIENIFENIVVNAGTVISFNFVPEKSKNILKYFKKLARVPLNPQRFLCR